MGDFYKRLKFLVSIKNYLACPEKLLCIHWVNLVFSSFVLIFSSLEDFI